MRESPLRRECTSSWPIHVLLHECFTFGPSLIKKNYNYLKYCIYFGGQQTFPKYKRYSYVRPLNTRFMVSLSFIGHWHGRGGISYPHSYHPAYPSPQQYHVQCTLVIKKSSGPIKFVLYNEISLYQGCKNNSIQRESQRFYFFIMKFCYISVLYNESAL